MDGQNYLVFHTAADDSYMNSSANFRGADVTSNTEITVYFAPVNSNRGNDSVVLNITAGKEIQVMEALGAALAGAKNPVTVVADDINSTYIHDNITSCGAISVLGGTYEDVEVITASQTLYSYDSGKTFVVNPAALTTITLPTAAAGLWYDIVLLQDTDAAFTIVAGSGDSVFGNIQVISTTDNKCSAVSITHATSTGTVASYDNIDLDHDTTTLGGKAGDVLRLTAVDSTAWLVQTTLTMDGNPSSGAVINAG